MFRRNEQPLDPYGSKESCTVVAPFSSRDHFQSPTIFRSLDPTVPASKSFHTERRPNTVRHVRSIGYEVDFRVARFTMHETEIGDGRGQSQIRFQHAIQRFAEPAFVLYEIGF